jgi:tRNA(Ile)-lysidine synthase
MALVILCYQLQKMHPGPGLKISDNSISKFYPFIVDHDLRQGSSEEAAAVEAAIKKKTRYTPRILKIHWVRDHIVYPPHVSPNDLPNIEALARQQRYRKLGSACEKLQIATLLMAHHEDDQYETVLMKLIGGHGYRGLGGIRPSNDIPECYDMHTVYQSGFIDDQSKLSPFWNTTPKSGQFREVKETLMMGANYEALKREVERGVRANVDFDFLEDYEGIARGTRRVPPVTPIPVEDGGVMIYRPLLQFSKDRLIATCLENDMPWFEDHTNADPTYTTRNAVRHMVKQHQLPVALQKPAILRLAERCRARVTREEAEADRLFSHLWIRDVELGVGTSVVQVRPFVFPRPTRCSLFSAASHRRRREHYRHIAALLLRRLLTLVTPERELPLVSQLDYLVSLLFPNLQDPKQPQAPFPPKAYTICGVLFTPLVGPYPFRWLLSRAPYPSNQPRPAASFFGLSFRKRYNKNPKDWKFNPWDEWKLYDGRYWIRLRVRLPCRPLVAPFEPEHLKPFREALKDDNERAKLSLMLKRYAPAKVRWTLPAIYATYDLGDLLEGGDYWPRRYGPEEARPPRGEGAYKDFVTQFGHQARLQWEDGVDKEGKKRLLALPTLGFQVPGLEKFMEWEIRYRKVGEEILRACVPRDVGAVYPRLPRTPGRREAKGTRHRAGPTRGRLPIPGRGRRTSKIRSPGLGWPRSDQFDGLR